MSSTSRPAAVSPSIRAWASPSLCDRMSRLTTTVLPRARSSASSTCWKARPIWRAMSSLSCEGTSPRTSYALKIPDMFDGLQSGLDRLQGEGESEVFDGGLAQDPGVYLSLWRQLDGQR